MRSGQNTDVEVNMNTPEELDQLNQSEDKNTQDIFPQGGKQPGVFSGSVTERETIPYGGENGHAAENGAEAPYAENQPSYGNDPYASQSQTPYGNDPRASQGQAPYGNDLYASQSQNTYGNNAYANQGQAPYGNDPYGTQSQSSYGTDAYAGQSQTTYGNNSYSGQNQSAYGNDAYGGQNQNLYGNNAYGVQNQNPYGNSPYGGQNQNPYGNNMYNGQNQNPYGNNAYGGQSQNPYGNNVYGGQSQNPYGNNAYGGQNQNPYGNNAYGGQNQSPYGNNPYSYPNGTVPTYGYGGNNPYSPYAVPQKRKTTTGVIVLVSGLIILFLIAVFALIFKMVRLYTEDARRTASSSATEQNGDGYERYFGEQDPGNEDPYGYGYGDDYGYGYDYDYDGEAEYDYDSLKYYELHDAIEEDLSYSVSFEEYEYDTDLETVAIMADYPVIKGDKVPNLDNLNETIRKEAMKFEEIFKEQYEDGIEKDGRYYDAYAAGYVTYMDEEKMSIVFSETVVAYDDALAYLYCINIDMEKGVVLENEQMLAIDDAFSVDFRTRSDEQNGEISDLTYMTDQQITQYFLSDDVIVFYTPKGMEIGFNYENGWVTVTYEEYEQYLKVF